MLVEKWQNNDFWSRAVSYASQFAAKKVPFERIVLDALNVTEFDFVSVAARWNTLNDFQKNLVWLWYRVYPTDEYYSYVCKKASNASEIPEKIRDEILLLSNRSERWIQERMAAVRALSFHDFDDAYFALMDKLPLDETKLKLLTYQTHEEKTYAVKVISNMLRSGAEPSAIATELLENNFPALTLAWICSLRPHISLMALKVWGSFTSEMGLKSYRILMAVLKNPDYEQGRRTLRVS